MGYYTIALIALLAAISPGPDFAVVVKNSIAHHRRSGIATAIGVAAGVVIHTSYCVLGLAVIISQSLLLFSLIKYLGATYLIYLGIKSIISKKPLMHVAVTPGADYGVWKSFREGFLTNLLNPKCTLFMLSIFTLVVKPHTPIWTQAIYALEIITITGIWFVFLSYGLTLKVVKKRLDQVQHIVTKLIGGLLIILGLTVIFKSH